MKLQGNQLIKQKNVHQKSILISALKGNNYPLIQSVLDFFIIQFYLLIIDKL